MFGIDSSNSLQLRYVWLSSWFMWKMHQFTLAKHTLAARSHALLDEHAPLLKVQACNWYSIKSLDCGKCDHQNFVSYGQVYTSIYSVSHIRVFLSSGVYVLYMSCVTLPRRQTDLCR